jgi:hypothetical protein
MIRITDTGFDLFRRVALEHMASITNVVGSKLDESELARLAELCDKLNAD